MKIPNNSNLSKEMTANIKDYSKKIKSLESFAKSVRKNPGQYLSSTGNEGQLNAIREVFQNATDELNRLVSPCDKVWIEFWEGSFRTVVIDNGRGIPAEDIVRVFSREHTSTNYEKHKGEYPSGLHGVGSKCTNAVSSRFTVTTYRLGKAYQIEFSEGEPLKKYGTGKKGPDGKEIFMPKEIKYPAGAQGTVVDFEPDFSIMGKITLTHKDIYRLVSNIVPLLKPGAEVFYTAHLLDGSTFTDHLVNKDGVLTYLINKTDKPMIKPIIYTHDTGEMKVEVAMTYVANVNAGPDVMTFANTSPVNTQLSTPSIGYFKGVCDFFKGYMNKIFLANNKKKLEVTNSDVLTGLVGIVAAAHMDVMFDGQAKNVCKTQELTPFVREITIEALKDWSKKNPDDLQKLCNFLKDVATARTKADKEKINISKKYKTNTISGTPKGFIKAEKKDHLELFIVEGLSAASPCQTSRNEYQAIFPIRGKMPNAFSKSREEFLKNEEVQAILAIIGCGYGKNFDISNCKYDKIIILADADYDGFHIRTLILKFLLTYCRPLIEEGRVYAVLSPLYHVDKGTKKWKYFIDKDDFTQYVRDEFVKANKVVHQKTKKEFTKSEISSLIINNNNYDFYMERIANNYMIDPILLEDLLLLRNEAFNKFNDFKKLISKKYKYLKIERKGDAVLLNGLVNGINGDREHTIIFNEQLINACSILLGYLDKSEKRYLLNGHKIGLYQLISTFRKSEPKNIERAKGLGSLNDIEIGVSTLNPQNRKLLRYTTEDITREIEEMRKVNDDKFTLIKDVDISQYEF